MKIDWTKQPTPEHWWLEALDKQDSEYSGWYVLDGSYWIDMGEGAWLATLEDDEFTVHRKPEEYVPEVGEWCLSRVGNELFYIGIDCEGHHAMQFRCGELVVHTSLDEFKPLPPKTEEELFIEKAMCATNGEQSDLKLRDLFSDMYQAGFKAPN